MLSLSEVCRIVRHSLLLIAVFGLSGCLTASDVREIVEESNNQMVATLTAPSYEYVGVEIDKERSDSKSWEQAANGLTEQIRLHADNPAIAEPLRLRLAYLFLTAGERNRAQVTYDSISNGGRFAVERDAILYASWDAFHWWAGVGDETAGMDNQDRDVNGPEHRATFIELATEDGRDPQLKAWLNYTAARIGYRYVLARFDRGEPIRAAITPVLNDYTKNFSPADTETFRVFMSADTDRKNLEDETILLLPWAARAYLVFCDSYRKLWKPHDGTAETFPVPDWVKQSLNVERDCYEPR